VKSNDDEKMLDSPRPACPPRPQSRAKVPRRDSSSLHLTSFRLGSLLAAFPSLPVHATQALQRSTVPRIPAAHNKMSPPIELFPASQLEKHVQVQANGRGRKTEGGKKIDLQACELLEMLQYECTVTKRERNAPVYCRPFVRLFRR
jgi:hypothetical protein